MKLRYIIPMFIAAVAMLAGCSDDDKKSYLSDVQVSQSYVAIAAGEEGDAATTEFQAEITVTASGNWEFKNVPDWLTVSPASGEAGQHTVVFKALKTTESRTANLKLACNGQEQEINVMQMAKKTEVPLSTCAQIIAADDGKTYRAKGAVKSIANTTYGNWYLQDETGEIYIYGTLDKNGAEKNFLSLGIEVGDIVTVEGPKTTYNGTVELVNVTVIAIEKSLIKVDSLDIKNNTLAKEGGEFHAVLKNKGNGLNIIIPDEAKDWLLVSGISISGTESVVTMRALPNEGGARQATVAFTTTNGGKTYTTETTISQEGSIIECPVSDFLAAEVGTSQYRLTGVITSLYASDKQGKSFYVRDYSGEVLVYRAEGFIEAGAKVGDVVTVVGQRGAYKNTPQMVSGTFEELKYAVTPISISDFRNVSDDKEKYYLLSGTINKVAEADQGAKDDVTKYGNFDLTDETGSVYIYGVLTGWGGSKGHFGELGLTYGDKLTVIAYKSTYKGLIEGVAVYVSSEKAE